MRDERNTQRRKAEALLALHHAPTPLLLPNAWDVVSGKIFEIEGFQAIGTTSAGISATLGYADGQRMRLGENLGVVRRIVDSTVLPVSADIEAGYSTSVDGVVRAACAALEVGAVGVNLEDGTGDPAAPLFDPALQREKIAAIRAMAAAEGIPLVVNARTDVYMVHDDPARNLRDAIARGNAYRTAGADCVFVPDLGDLDAQTIAILVKEIAAPINLIAGANTPPVPVLQELGVARVSLGPRAMRAVLSVLRRIAKELMTTGTYQLLSDSSISYDDVNGWFDRRAGAGSGGDACT